VEVGEGFRTLGPIENIRANVDKSPGHERVEASGPTFD